MAYWGAVAPKQTNKAIKITFHKFLTVLLLLTCYQTSSFVRVCVFVYLCTVGGM